MPVPSYIRVLLPNGFPNNNIFSGSSKPYNKGYFSLVWRRFKRHYPTVEPSVTIYSFRHSGAIDIFKRTGSITKLQKAMGHSSINVSLTYLRGYAEDLIFCLVQFKIFNISFFLQKINIPHHKIHCTIINCISKIELNICPHSFPSSF